MTDDGYVPMLRENGEDPAEGTILLRRFAAWLTRWFR